MSINKEFNEYIGKPSGKRFFVARDKPALIINAKGIENNSTYFGIGFLSWDDIEGVFLYELDGVYIGVESFNSEEIKKQASFIQRLGCRLIKKWQLRRHLISRQEI